MTGVKDTIVYQGPEGKVTRQEGTAFTQYHAVRQTITGPKGRYYETKSGAVNWLKRQAKPFASQV